MMDCLCLPLPLSKTIPSLNCFPRYLHYSDTVSMSALVKKSKSHPAASTRTHGCCPSAHGYQASPLTHHKASVHLFTMRRETQTEGRGGNLPMGWRHHTGNISFSFTTSSWWTWNILRFLQHIKSSETAFSSYHKHTHRASCPNLTADRTFKFWMTLWKGIIWDSGN